MGLRTIVEDQRFKTERDTISPNIARWDEVQKGVIWGLSRKPERVGKPTEADGIFAVATDDWPDVPSVVIYYTFDDKTVILKSVILASVPEA